MEDLDIVNLIYNRNEIGIAELKMKDNELLYSLALSILKNDGVITENEFTECKQRILSENNGKSDTKIQYNLDPANLKYTSSKNESIINDRELLSILRFFNVNKTNVDKCVRGFAKIAREYTEEQIQLIISKLPLDVRIILEDNSKEYFRYAKVSVKQTISENQQNTVVTRDLNRESGVNSSGVIIPNQTSRIGIFRKLNGQK